MLSACDCTLDIGLHVSNAQMCPVSIDCPIARDLLSTCRCGDQGKAAFPFCNLLTTRAENHHPVTVLTKLFWTSSVVSVSHKHAMLHFAMDPLSHPT